MEVRKLALEDVEDEMRDNHYIRLSIINKLKVKLSTSVDPDKYLIRNQCRFFLEAYRIRNGHKVLNENTAIPICRRDFKCGHYSDYKYPIYQ